MSETLKLSSIEKIKILQKAKKDKVKVKHLCQHGLCGKCKIKLISGDVSEPNKKEIKKLGEEAIKEGYRLACQATFTGDVEFIQE